MAVRPLHGLALCAGVGGIELGLKLALRGHYRCVGYVEREAYAAAVLVARMADAALDPAPVWDDLETFDGRPWRGKVDIVTSGLPCQPYSVAGAQRGHEDERTLWPHFIRIVRECEPTLVFIENVPEFLKHFEPIWDELCGLGFDFAPPALFTAEEVGAPHIRRRLFILAAHPARFGVGLQQAQGQPDPSLARELSATTHSDGRRCEIQRRRWVLDRERQTLRNDADRCGCGQCDGGSFWATEPPLLRVDDGPPERVDELRAIGNGVVPQVVAAAFRYLVRHTAPGVAVGPPRSALPSLPHLGSTRGRHV